MPKKQLIMVRTRKISPIESHSAPLTFTHPSLNIILYHNFKIILPTGGNRQVNHTKQGQIPRNGETPCPFPGGPGRKTDGRHAENEKVLAAEYSPQSTLPNAARRCGKLRPTALRTAPSAGRLQPAARKAAPPLTAPPGSGKKRKTSKKTKAILPLFPAYRIYS